MFCRLCKRGGGEADRATVSVYRGPAPALQTHGGPSPFCLQLPRLRRSVTSPVRMRSGVCSCIITYQQFNVVHTHRVWWEKRCKLCDIHSIKGGKRIRSLRWSDAFNVDLCAFFCACTNYLYAQDGHWKTVFVTHRASLQHRIQKYFSLFG